MAAKGTAFPRRLSRSTISANPGLICEMWARYPWHFVMAGLVLGVWLALASDHRLHWDEPGYLYAAAYLDVNTILAGEFQPSGIAKFSISRSLHVLLMHGIFSLTGPGPVAITVIQCVYLAMLVATLLLMARIMIKLLPDHRHDLPVAIGLMALSPIVLWLGCKTMPETPALFLSTSTCYALLNATMSTSRAAGWIVLAGIAGTLTVFFKNIMVLTPATMVVSLLIVGSGSLSRLRIAITAGVAGLFSMSLFFILLALMGISLADYLAATQELMSEPESVVVKAYFTMLEGGALFASILLAPFAGNRRGAALFLLWFALSTVPLLLLVPDIEERYLLPNVMALAGLTVLAVAAARRLIEGSKPAGAVLTMLAFLIVGLSSGTFQRIMAQDVAVDDIDDMMTALDERFGPRNYTIVSPWEFSTFLFLRVAFPEYSVVNAHTPSSWKVPVWTADEQRRFFGARLVENASELAPLRRPLVYMGFEENLSVANLRQLITLVPSEQLRNTVSKMIAAKVDETHLQSSWLWSQLEPQEPDMIIGHYKAFVLPEPLE